MPILARDLAGPPSNSLYMHPLEAQIKMLRDPPTPPPQKKQDFDASLLYNLIKIFLMIQTYAESKYQSFDYKVLDN